MQLTFAMTCCNSFSKSSSRTLRKCHRIKAVYIQRNVSSMLQYGQMISGKKKKKKEIISQYSLKPIKIIRIITSLLFIHMCSPTYAQIWHCLCAMLSPSSKLLQVACLAIFSQNNSWINTEWMEET